MYMYALATIFSMTVNTAVKHNATGTIQLLYLCIVAGTG